MAIDQGRSMGSGSLGQNRISGNTLEPISFPGVSGKDHTTHPQTKKRREFIQRSLHRSTWTTMRFVQVLEVVPGEPLVLAELDAHLLRAVPVLQVVQALRCNQW
ncbi:hypothetical protein PSFL111601_21560 [Pseudomonas floridensis]